MATPNWRVILEIVCAKQLRRGTGASAWPTWRWRCPAEKPGRSAYSPFPDRFLAALVAREDLPSDNRGGCPVPSLSENRIANVTVKWKKSEHCHAQSSRGNLTYGGGCASYTPRLTFFGNGVFSGSLDCGLKSLHVAAQEGCPGTILALFCCRFVANFSCQRA